MIDIQHVTKRYGALYALRDVSLHVEKGSVLGLLGQNGAGKTTLINILTGYLAPTEGRALLAGHDALLEPEEARKHLGYLPEVPPLYDEMTVREYLRFAARLKGVESRAVPAHVDEIMELCGLTQMQRRLLSHLSKGWRRRCAATRRFWCWTNPLWDWIPSRSPKFVRSSVVWAGKRPFCFLPIFSARCSSFATTWSFCIRGR